MRPPSDGNPTTRIISPAAGNNRSAAQPHTGSADTVAEAEQVAARSTSRDSPVQRPDTPVSPRSPFLNLRS
jgi:hypothetical protein